MGCPEQQAKLREWVLEELSPSEVRELELHVEQCADCARSLDRLRGVRHALRQHLSDREMPAHLVFLEEKKRLPTGFLATLWRTAALAALTAVVFLGILLGGYANWGKRPFVVGVPVEKSTLTRAEVEAMIGQAVEKSFAQQKRELEVAKQELQANWRQEQIRHLAALARQLQYLESAQAAVWKETQQQNALVELIARNSLRNEATRKP